MLGRNRDVLVESLRVIQQHDNHRKIFDEDGKQRDAPLLSKTHNNVSLSSSSSPSIGTMSISYEEALATLQAMFGEPWTREMLDVVLRHEKGHMENTCELILQHGDKDPKILVDRLKSGGPEPQVAMDEQLARQLAAPSSGNVGGSAATSSGGRGTPTVLPDDFLRIPGYKPSTSASGATAGAMDDETLARMLQDELFSEELARNPDFAHLARGGRRSTRTSASNARIPAGRGTAGVAPLQNPFEGVNLMQKVSGM